MCSQYLYKNTHDAMKSSVLEKVSELVITKLEIFFYKWGVLVASRPVSVISTCLVITALSSIGFLKFRQELRNDKIYIPEDSEYLKNLKWLDENYPREIRRQFHLYKDKNVLTTKTLKLLLHSHLSILNATTGNYTWNDACYRLPITNLFINKKRKKRQAKNVSIGWNYEEYVDDYQYYYEEEEEDQLFEQVFTDTDDSAHSETVKDLPQDIYCDLINTLNEKCWESSLLEIWNFNSQRILQATDEDIIYAVNKYVQSPAYGYKFKFERLLGGIQYNSTGHIIGAEALLNIWFTATNVNKVPVLEGGIGFNLADADTLTWEEAFVQTSDQLHFNAANQNVTLHYNAERSFNDVTRSAIGSDSIKLVVGYTIMFVYTVFMLGSTDVMEPKIMLTIVGLLGIFLGVVCAYGLMFAFGHPFTVLLQVLVLLCLGVGIDDMFVIMQCFQNQPSNADTNLAEKIGKTLKHAGVAITVTSFTDIFAFGIGTLTVIPGLMSFCLGCSLAILVIFSLQLSWFIAWLSIDAKHFQRKGIFPLNRIKKNLLGDKVVSIDIWKYLLMKISPYYGNKAFTVVVISLALGTLGGGIYGVTRLKVKFDFFRYIPSDTHTREFVDAKAKWYPKDGNMAEIFFINPRNLSHDLLQLDRMVDKLEEIKLQNIALSDVDCWLTEYKEYLNQTLHMKDWTMSLESNFSLYLSDFLFSQRGANYKDDFKLDGELICGSPAPEVLVFKCEMKYLIFDDLSEHFPARKVVSAAIDSNNFSCRVFDFDLKYAEWEVDDLLAPELLRNLSLAAVGVFIILLLLLANIKICIMVQLCVVLTLVDMIGCLHYWNVYLDIVVAMLVIVIIGICVDYAAHIGHAFLINEGTKVERAQLSVQQIGPPIINGGITTFLAVVSLAFSITYPFRLIFKVFTLAVFFGLFHGIFFLPVLLANWGPGFSIKRKVESQDYQKNGEFNDAFTTSL